MTIKSKGTFAEVIDGYPENVKKIARRLREKIDSLDFDVVEVPWAVQKIAGYGVGPKKMSQHFAYIAPQRNYVNLGFYHGISLSDPSSLLEGTGKKLRHVKIFTLSDCDKPDIFALLNESLKERLSRGVI
jgi:hypothetical protein